MNSGFPDSRHRSRNCSPVSTIQPLSNSPPSNGSNGFRLAPAVLRLFSARRPMNERIHAFQAARDRGEPIAVLTAYDFPMARLLDESGVDVVLVGDSLGMVVLGYPDTTLVTM